MTTEKFGAIVLANGFSLFDPAVYGEYGYGRYPDVITSIQMERLMNAAGPTGGEIRRPVRRQASAQRGLPGLRRLARRARGPALLLQDLLHVHGQARDHAQGARSRTCRATCSTWMCGPAARATTSSSAGRRRNTAPAICAAGCPRSTRMAITWS